MCLTAEPIHGLMTVPGGSTTIGFVLREGGMHSATVRPTRMMWKRNGTVLRGTEDQSNMVMEVDLKRRNVETIKYSANYNETEDSIVFTLHVRGIGM